MREATIVQPRPLKAARVRGSLRDMYHDGSSPLAAKDLSTAYTTPSVVPTIREPGPGASMTAGHAMRQGVTLHM